MITLWGSTYAKFVCSIILKHPHSDFGLLFNGVYTTRPLDFRV